MHGRARSLVTSHRVPFSEQTQKAMKALTAKTSKRDLVFQGYIIGKQAADSNRVLALVAFSGARTVRFVQSGCTQSQRQGNTTEVQAHRVVEVLSA